MTSKQSIGPAAAILGILLAALPGGALADTAEYQVVFESTWSQTTHPLNFPGNPHYSPLVGGTHTDQVSFWDLGGLATTGIRIMAEQGGTTELLQEVQAAISGGTADATLLGGAMPDSPGMVAMTFTVDAAYPLVTLVSMLAPSPDWFVGVSGLNMRDNGQWQPQIIVPLELYDAGTDSGVDYVSPNQPTVPQVSISHNTTGPFASDPMVGTFTFTRTSLLDVPGARSLNEAGLVVLGPNPLRSVTRFQIRVPSGRTADLSVYGVGGQRIRGLFSGATSGNPFLVTWDGRGDGGSLVPPGMYFASLRVDGRPEQSERIVVVR